MWAVCPLYHHRATQKSTAHFRRKPLKQHRNLPSLTPFTAPLNLLSRVIHTYLSHGLYTKGTCSHRMTDTYKAWLKKYLRYLRYLRCLRCLRLAALVALTHSQLVEPYRLRSRGQKYLPYVGVHLHSKQAREERKVHTYNTRDRGFVDEGKTFNQYCRRWIGFLMPRLFFLFSSMYCTVDTVGPPQNIAQVRC